MRDKNQLLYSNYEQILQKAADFNNAAAVLGWDQEVYMPAGGAEARARQLATLSAAAHEMLTSEQLGALLHKLAASSQLTEVQQANIKWSLDDYNKNKKLPVTFVERLSRQSSACFNAWVDSRANDDFAGYSPLLAKMIELKKEQAELYGYDGHPYNALLDEYDAGSTVAQLDTVFNTISAHLLPILQHIQSLPQVDNSFFNHFYPKDEQWNFSVDVLKMMGYDFNCGRQDYAAHPFTTSFSATDVRITTRADEHNFSYLLWSTIHEGGHALYEQGLPSSQYGLPAGSPASLAIHESQSRLWENCVGRGLDFWAWWYPRLQQAFPQQLEGVSLAAFYRGMNRVEASFIRTEADELTYHFHVLIRYEMEKAIIGGNVPVNELPDLWNSLYKQYLGIVPPDFSSGILQDVHWNHGSFGYFPTYSTGSFYAAQFFATVKEHLPGLAIQLQQGDASALLQWLRDNIHVKGRQLSSEELCRQVTGTGLEMSHFVDYAQRKYAFIYA